MNYENDIFYTTIKNSPALLNEFFAGLHHVCRLALGNKSPRAALGKDVLLWGCAYETPGYTAIPTTNSYTQLSSGFIDQVLNTMETDGYEMDDINDTRKALDRSVLDTLMKEYGLQMLVFARDNATYNTNWEQAPVAA